MLALAWLTTIWLLTLVTAWLAWVAVERSLALRRRDRWRATGGRPRLGASLTDAPPAGADDATAWLGEQRLRDRGRPQTRPAPDAPPEPPWLGGLDA